MLCCFQINFVRGLNLQFMMQMINFMQLRWDPKIGGVAQLGEKACNMFLQINYRDNEDMKM